MSKFCPKCGKEVADNAQVCDGCGMNFAAQNPDPSAQNTGYTPPPGQATGADEVFSDEDIQKNKTMAGLAYLIFFLPLIACPESRFARFHANQGLILLILGVAISIISIIPVLGCITGPIGAILVIVLAIMGMVNGFGGIAKTLPLIGKFTLLK